MGGEALKEGDYGWRGLKRGSLLYDTISSTVIINKSYPIHILANMNPIIEREKN